MGCRVSFCKFRDSCREINWKRYEQIWTHGFCKRLQRETSSNLSYLWFPSDNRHQLIAKGALCLRLPNVLHFKGRSFSQTVPVQRMSLVFYPLNWKLRIFSLDAEHLDKLPVGRIILGGNPKTQTLSCPLSFVLLKGIPKWMRNSDEKIYRPNLRGSVYRDKIGNVLKYRATNIFHIVFVAYRTPIHFRTSVPCTKTFLIPRNRYRNWSFLRNSLPFVRRICWMLHDFLAQFDLIHLCTMGVWNF